MLVNILLTFVLTHSLNVDWMEAFAIHVRILVIFRRLNSYMGAIHAADNTRKASVTIKCVLVHNKFGHLWAI